MRARACGSANEQPRRRRWACSCCRCSTEQPPSLTVVDRKALRLEAAKAVGAASVADALDSQTFAVAVDATGAPSAIEAAFESLERGGRLLTFGVTSGDASVSLSPFRIYNDEIGSMAVLNSFGAAADLMAAGAIDTVSVVVERRVPAAACDAGTLPVVRAWCRAQRQIPRTTRRQMIKRPPYLRSGLSPATSL